jgi:hypothetical protein
MLWEVTSVLVDHLCDNEVRFKNRDIDRLDKICEQLGAISAKNSMEEISTRSQGEKKR